MRMSNYRLRGLMLITTVVAVAAWILLAGGIFLTQSSQFQMLGASKMEEQARQYAEVDANLLQLIEYGKLTDSSTLASYKLHTNRAQIQTVDAPDWEDAISIGSEQTASSGGVYRVATIDIYRKGDTEPRVSLNVPIVKDAQMYSRSQLDKMIADATAAAKAAAEAAKKAAEEAAGSEGKKEEQEIKYTAFVIPEVVVFNVEYTTVPTYGVHFRIYFYDLTSKQFAKMSRFDLSPLNLGDEIFHIEDVTAYGEDRTSKNSLDCSFIQGQYLIQKNSCDNAIKKLFPDTEFKMLFDRYTLANWGHGPSIRRSSPTNIIVRSSNITTIKDTRYVGYQSQFTDLMIQNGYPAYSFW